MRAMSHQATVVYVMIASPGDIPEFRDAAYTAITEWNHTFTERSKIVLLPLRWEINAVPLTGAHAQTILNEQLVAKADIVVALFGSRLGTATPTAPSGTAEEIKEADAQGKPVHIYFSSAPVPRDVDPKDLAALNEFRKALEETSLYSKFETSAELRQLIWHAVEKDISYLNLIGGEVVASSSGVDFLAQPGEEREMKTDSKGRVRYSTRRWLEITNRGSVDAEEVVIESLDPGVHLGHSDGPIVIHGGQVRRIPMMRSLQAGEPKVKISWVENGKAQEKVFFVG